VEQREGDEGVPGRRLAGQRVARVGRDLAGGGEEEERGGGREALLDRARVCARSRVWDLMHGFVRWTRSGWEERWLHSGDENLGVGWISSDG
jgi:hypothetical protein